MLVTTVAAISCLRTPADTLINQVGVNLLASALDKGLALLKPPEKKRLHDFTKECLKGAIQRAADSAEGPIRTKILSFEPHVGRILGEESETFGSWAHTIFLGREAEVRRTLVSRIQRAGCDVDGEDGERAKDRLAVAFIAESVFLIAEPRHGGAFRQLQFLALRCREELASDPRFFGEVRTLEGDSPAAVEARIREALQVYQSETLSRLDAIQRGMVGLHEKADIHTQKLDETQATVDELRAELRQMRETYEESERRLIALHRYELADRDQQVEEFQRWVDHQKSRIQALEEKLSAAEKARDDALRQMSVQEPDQLRAEALRLESEGKAEEADQLYEREARRLAKEGVRRTLDRIMLWRRQGNLDRALTLWNGLPAIEEGALIESVVNVGNEVLTLCRKLGKYHEGVKVGERAHRLAQLLGPEHPNTLTSANNLAVLYSDTGRFSEAEELYDEVLNVQRRVLEPEHPDTLSAAYNFILLHIESGKAVDRSHTLFQEFFPLALKLPEGHPVRVGWQRLADFLDSA